ncbi:MAG: hypothetical protein AMXMBFR52_30190 [Burkholderiales bacterium]
MAAGRYIGARPRQVIAASVLVQAPTRKIVRRSNRAFIPGRVAAPITRGKRVPAGARRAEDPVGGARNRAAPLGARCCAADARHGRC